MSGVDADRWRICDQNIMFGTMTTPGPETLLS